MSHVRASVIDIIKFNEKTISILAREFSSYQLVAEENSILWYSIFGTLSPSSLRPDHPSAGFVSLCDTWGSEIDDLAVYVSYIRSDSH